MNLKSFLASKVRRLLLLLFDISCFALVSVGYFVANLLFEPYIPYKSINFFANAVVLLLFILVVRSAFGVYNSILRYTRTFNHFKLMIADVVGAVAAMKEKIKDGSVDAQIKILEAMTAEERANPEKIFANAKARIAETAGCTVREVEHMIKQYTKMKQQMAMIQRMGGMEAVMQRMQQGGGFPGAK